MGKASPPPIKRERGGKALPSPHRKGEGGAPLLQFTHSETLQTVCQSPDGNRTGTSDEPHSRFRSGPGGRTPTPLEALGRVDRTRKSLIRIRSPPSSSSHREQGGPAPLLLCIGGGIDRRGGGPGMEERRIEEGPPGMSVGGPMWEGSLYFKYLWNRPIFLLS